MSLTQAKVNASVDAFNVPEELELEQGYRASYEIPSEHEGTLYVYVELRLSATETGEGSNTPAIDLEATYRLVYELVDAKKYPEDALHHFAELNGAYNIWPYWRELVQTVSGRAGLASIVVPVLKLPVRKLTPEEEEQLEFSVTESTRLNG